MPDRSPPPLNDALMALFAGAAPLYERAKAAGLFRPAPVDVTPPAPPEPPAPPSPAEAAAPTDAAKLAALQDIVVAQAQKIVALEAEIARLKG